MTKTILITGWRFLPHSYAIVNQFQCLELMRTPGVELGFEDSPFYRESWKPMRGLMSDADEAAIESLRPLATGETADVELRITFPYDLITPSKAGNLFVFATAEHKGVPPGYLLNGTSFAAALEADPDVHLITPSHWSRAGLIEAGADPDQVSVVPHGIDPRVYRPPTPGERSSARKAQGLADDEFTFLTVGAMTGTKNADLTLRAFAGVLHRYPRARLILKGTDDLYPSYEMFKAALAQALLGIEMALVLPRIKYIGGSLSFKDMAALYHAADCYVTPYSAEGFNIPPLEAAGCGVPVICTAGGPTDDFLTADSALKIRSTEVDVDIVGTMMSRLQPDSAHLEQLMIQVVEDADFRRRAVNEGSAHVHANFTWRHAVDKLLKVLFPADQSNELG